MVPGCPSDRQGLLHCYGTGVLHWHHRYLPDGAFQPAALLAFPWGSLAVSPPGREQHGCITEQWRRRLSGVSQEETSDF